MINIIKIALVALISIPALLSNTSLTPSQLASQKRIQTLQEEMRCMATALHYEARGESRMGQRAVFEVIRNRANKTGQSWCEVIAKPKQFSFLNSGKISLKEKLDSGIERVYHNVMTWDSDILDSTDVTHYHATYVKPKWAKKMVEVKVIGIHKFYKLKEK